MARLTAPARTRPAGVLEQVLDCSGGEDISEESGRQRKLDALLALLRGQVLLTWL